jgi:hypothetical protein
MHMLLRCFNSWLPCLFLFLCNASLVNRWSFWTTYSDVLTFLNAILFPESWPALWFPLSGTGDPWVTRDPAGMGLGKKLCPWRVVGFLTGGSYVNGHGFGQAKPSGFTPVAISKRKLLGGEARRPGMNSHTRPRGGSHDYAS